MDKIQKPFNSQFVTTKDPKYAVIQVKCILLSKVITRPLANNGFHVKCTRWPYLGALKHFRVSKIISRLIRVVWLTKRAPTILELNWFERLWPPGWHH